MSALELCVFGVIIPQPCLVRIISNFNATFSSLSPCSPYIGRESDTVCGSGGRHRAALLFPAV